MECFYGVFSGHPCPKSSAKTLSVFSHSATTRGVVRSSRRLKGRRVSSVPTHSKHSILAWPLWGLDLKDFLLKFKDFFVFNWAHTMGTEPISRSIFNMSKVSSNSSSYLKLFDGNYERKTEKRRPRLRYLTLDLGPLMSQTICSTGAHNDSLTTVYICSS